MHLSIDRAIGVIAIVLRIAIVRNQAIANARNQAIAIVRVDSIMISISAIHQIPIIQCHKNREHVSLTPHTQCSTKTDANYNEDKSIENAYDDVCRTSSFAPRLSFSATNTDWKCAGITLPK